MPLPFILAGAAIAAAGYGAKKGYDGYQDKEKAEQIVKNAKKRYEESKSKFDSGEKVTNSNLNKLGELQIKIGQDFKKFEDLVKELSVQLEKSSDKKLDIDIPQHKLNKMKALEISATSFLSKAVGGLAGGAAAAYAVYGGVMALGAASTGVSIASLSGVAAYNATLAAIGGGSLAAGGLGMAGGAAILGGVVAAPIIAIAGWAYASHAEEALSDAYRIDDEADKAISKLNKAHEQLKELNRYTVRIYKETNKIYEVFGEYIEKLYKIQLLKDVDHDSFKLVVNRNTDGIISTIQNGYKLAAILTDIITTPLFKVKEDNNGKTITDNNNIPVFQVDNDGQRIINTEVLDSALDKANSDLRQV